ncbi:ABC transporter ATP-binding protein [Ornithinimicrobium sp. F0845]|uniref:ABC transporter ATP-binding protein n=1 Tax=Ornithinimicrobium sp. F0845 TaxID=2926412 RepID=UPI001FF67F9F|nr:ABC transporter ATP-binding protein [Ornithinimicrobium sp. F0845]MCK0113858.1 ABC transporter ATP-binding protein [Ornithinimicrobium sp. F0845]
MDAPIVVEQLHKSFGSTHALDGLDLRAEQGEVHGFLGPNGSGKSTTIRVLLGLLRPDAGRAVLLGGDPWRDAATLHRHLAYVPGDVALWPGLSGGEVIDLIGRLRGGLDETRRAELLRDFELDATKKSRTYSKGNRQKVALVAALASRADLLILDEPTNGLDPLMAEVFQTWIRRVKDEGHTVLLSSHILAEVEALCDRVSIIRAGATVQSGTLADLRHLTTTTVIAETVRPADGLAGVTGVSDLERTDGRVTFQVDTKHLDGAVAHLSSLGIRSLISHPPTLEELFLTQYGDRLPEHAGSGQPGADSDQSGAVSDRSGADSDQAGADPGQQRGVEGGRP